MDKLQALKKYFGYDSFKEGQETAIDTLLGGGDVLCVMPTGGGKSLCYQLPAVIKSGIVLVISPLISLMKDQVDQLRENGIPAAFINSTLTPGQQYTAMERIRAGAYRVVYIAPERLDMPAFTELAAEIDISVIAVDEAHCVSQWGQDFRPSYLRIGGFIDTVAQTRGTRPAVCAMTATATERVRADIVEMLGLKNPRKVVTSFDRPNLRFEVRRPSARNSELLDIVREMQGESGIIYCGTRKNVEEVCAMLREKGVNALPYHAGLSAAERTDNQNDFIYDRCPVIVATNAFGMGINKSNVAFVIHYNMPKDLESYYQEAGRAGRDGRPARCVLLYSRQDIALCRFFIEHSEAEDSGLDAEQRAAKRRADEARLYRMVDYCESKTCLRGFILQYFGESYPELCHNCSCCAEIDSGSVSVKTADVTVEAQKILSCVIRINRMGRSFGKSMVTKVLTGEEDERVTMFGLEKLPTFGAMSGGSKELISEVTDLLIRKGLLIVENVGEGSRAQVLRAGAAAMEFLRQKQPLYYIYVENNGRKAKGKDKQAVTPSRLPDELAGLYDKLRTLRTNIAYEIGMPPYVVMSNSTLHDMCCRLPMSKEEMMEVQGIGEVKYERYGERFLELILREMERDGDTLRRAKDEILRGVERVSAVPVAPRRKDGREAFSLSEEQRRQVEIKSEGVGVNDIARAMNSLIDKEKMVCATGKMINDWLTEKGYLETEESEGGTRRVPTERGKELGIESEVRVWESDGKEYVFNVFSEKAQRFVVENFAAS